MILFRHALRNRFLLDFDFGTTRSVLLFDVVKRNRKKLPLPFLKIFECTNKWLQKLNPRVNRFQTLPKYIPGERARLYSRVACWRTSNKIAAHVRIFFFKKKLSKK